MTPYEIVAICLSSIAIIIPIAQWAWKRWVQKPILNYHPNGTARLLFNQSGSYLQIDGVYDVEFTVNEQPLMNKDEQAIGVMDEGSFLEDQENISNYNEYSYITIYFSDSTGKKLKEYNEQIEFEPNVPVEQIVMNQLLNGPQEKGYKDTIPKGTKVNSVVTKEGICYIDLSSEFLAQQEGVSPEVVIYSVVNSLAELPTVNKVQFTVNGEKVKKYQETVTFSGVIERNLEIVEQ